MVACSPGTAFPVWREGLEEEHTFVINPHDNEICIFVLATRSNLKYQFPGNATEIDTDVWCHRTVSLIRQAWLPLGQASMLNSVYKRPLVTFLWAAIDPRKELRNLRLPAGNLPLNPGPGRGNIKCIMGEEESKVLKLLLWTEDIGASCKKLPV